MSNLVNNISITDKHANKSGKREIIHITGQESFKSFSTTRDLTHILNHFSFIFLSLSFFSISGKSKYRYFIIFRMSTKNTIFLNMITFFPVIFFLLHYSDLVIINYKISLYTKIFVIIFFLVKLKFEFDLIQIPLKYFSYF